MIFIAYLKQAHQRFSRKVCPNYWRVSFLKGSVAWMRNDKATKMLKEELAPKLTSEVGEAGDKWKDFEITCHKYTSQQPVRPDVIK